MGKIMDLIFGSEGEIDWDELQRMIELQEQINKTDRQGVFGGWEWERDPEGNATNRQVQNINPAFQGAVDALGQRALNRNTNYQSPSQFSDLMNAKMSTQMAAHGIPANSQGVQTWQNSQDRGGLTNNNAFVPPPPPVDGMPPGEPAAPPTFGIADPRAPVDYLPGESPQEIKEADPLYGLPPDYYNDKGNIKRKYRPDHKTYIGDEFLQRYADDPDYQFREDDPNNPAEWYNKKGRLKDVYRMGSANYRGPGG